MPLNPLYIQAHNGKLAARQVATLLHGDDTVKKFAQEVDTPWPTVYQRAQVYNEFSNYDQSQLGTIRFLHCFTLTMLKNYDQLTADICSLIPANRNKKFGLMVRTINV
jgi:hypothetical protein